ncbi:hypothetical protein [Cellvibrio polysaccharolyticus]|uniref:Rho termination factor N-terminal domain-containing protein n=1 Tax=Cellvibrio polysaccharolyticus TaxID=2082724 RepID=A0A928YVD2_9GAMM|nr:hypothetical protein [Cellvibrio polysaccharolyticus]MBE8718917.1 hypothetical protein [Cellvibrio polysaccharolyticus]
MNRVDVDSLKQSNGRLKENFSNHTLKRQALNVSRKPSHLSIDNMSYENWGWDDLYREAADMGIKNCARLTRRDLISSLTNH